MVQNRTDEGLDNTMITIYDGVTAAAVRMACGFAMHSPYSGAWWRAISHYFKLSNVTQCYGKAAFRTLRSLHPSIYGGHG